MCGYFFSYIYAWVDHKDYRHIYIIQGTQVMIYMFIVPTNVLDYARNVFERELTLAKVKEGS